MHVLFIASAIFMGSLLRLLGRLDLPEWYLIHLRIFHSSKWHWTQCHWIRFCVWVIEKKPNFLTNRQWQTWHQNLGFLISYLQSLSAEFSSACSFSICYRIVSPAWVYETVSYQVSFLSSSLGLLILLIYFSLGDNTTFPFKMDFLPKQNGSFVLFLPF